jgi:hypothetical protein
MHDVTPSRARASAVRLSAWIDAYRIKQKHALDRPAIKLLERLPATRMSCALSISWG